MTKPIPLPTQDRLLELFSHDAETGDLVWKISTCNRIKIGDIAGCMDSGGYRRVRVAGRSYKAHRLIWKMVYGVDPIEQLDHINHAKLDNCIINLREVSNTENSRNQKRRNNNTSGFVGVYWYKKTRKWRAMIKVNWRQKNLGFFDDKSEAIAARQEAEIKYGFHHNHGSN